MKANIPKSNGMADMLRQAQKMQEDMVAKQAELEEEKVELEGLLAEADQLLKELEKDIEKAIREYEIAEAARAAAAAELSNLVAELNRQNQEIANANNNNNNANAGGNTGSTGGNTGNTGSSGNGGLISAGSEGVQGTGSLVWPVPCSHTVTSRFGPRTHPITGKYTNHNGMDIDGYGHDGYPIVACDAGVVVAAKWSDSYGNYVMIYHADGSSTVYAHMSSLAVSAGQYVNQGDVIGYVGSTGNSTGPHLHFEVRQDGKAQNPVAYFDSAIRDTLAAE